MAGVGGVHGAGQTCLWPLLDAQQLQPGLMQSVLGRTVALAPGNEVCPELVPLQFAAFRGPVRSVVAGGDLSLLERSYRPEVSKERLSLALLASCAAGLPLENVEIVFLQRC